MAYYLQDISVKELREILMSKTRTVIVPVGVVEQHGYHLPLGVDIYNTQMLLELGKDQIDAVIAPTVPYCFSGGELTGTLNVSPQVFSLFLSDITVELAKTGFQNIVVLLGHAGTDNAMALKNCLQMILRRNKELDITLSYVAGVGSVSHLAGEFLYASAGGLSRRKGGDLPYEILEARAGEGNRRNGRRAHRLHDAYRSRLV